jgi:hypothetical protein
MEIYLLAFQGGGMPETEEEQAKVMASWGEWYEKLGAAVKDGGNPIRQAKTIATDGAVSDGGGANPVSGYTLLNAADIDAAIEMAKSCPILESGGSIEVAEALLMA